jgi:hypothetical protein
MRWSLAALVFLLSAQDGGIEFKNYTLTMHGTRQDTITYDFNGDGRLDIVSTCIDQEADPPIRWAFFYLQKADESFDTKPDRILPIPDKVVSLVFGDYEGDAAVEFGFLASDGFYVYPTGADQPTKLIHTAVFFTLPSTFVIPVWQYRQDLDANGLDDLILPAEKGYKVYFQTEKGKFHRMQELPTQQDPPSRAVTVSSRATQDRYRATALRFEKLLPRLEIADINADGKKDLVSVTRDLLTIFFMTPEGTYDVKLKERRIVKTLTAKEEAGAVEVSGIQFVDLNGDKLPELVITKIEGQLGMIDSLQTNIYIHRGNGTAAFTPDQSLYIPGLSFFPTFIDMDGDGKIDLYATFVSTGVIQKLLEAKIMGDINVSTGFWRYTDKGFRDMDYVHELLVKTEVVEKRSGIPVIYVGGDFNGDKRPDMIVVLPNQQIGFHMGREHFKGGATLIGFEANASQTIPITDQPNFIQFLDLNKDGITDLQHLYGSRAVLSISKKR